LEKKTILVADDEELMRNIIRRFCAHFDYEKIICEDAESAVPNIDKADILITDLEMPGMNGIELTKAAKEEKPEMPVILMTGKPWIVPEDHPADELLSKPFDIEDLRKTVARLLAD